MMNYEEIDFSSQSLRVFFIETLYAWNLLHFFSCKVLEKIRNRLDLISLSVVGSLRAANRNVMLHKVRQ